MYYFGPKNIWTLVKMIVIDNLLNYAIAHNLIWNVFVWHKTNICFSTRAPEYPGVPHLSCRPDNHACMPSRALQPNKKTSLPQQPSTLCDCTLHLAHRANFKPLTRESPGLSRGVCHSLSRCLPFSLTMSAILSRDVCHSLSCCLPFSLAMSAILFHDVCHSLSRCLLCFSCVCQYTSSTMFAILPNNDFSLSRSASQCSSW